MRMPLDLLVTMGNAGIFLIVQSFYDPSRTTTGSLCLSIYEVVKILHLFTMTLEARVAIEPDQ